MPPVADTGLVSILDTVGRYVALPAMLGILLLLPLYLSQRRDVVRLRAWMDRDPGHPLADIRASETMLDRAEADLEALLVERGEPVAAAAPATATPPGATPPAAAAAGPPTVEAPAAAAEPTTGGGGTPMTPIPAARRVTAERPALTRITMERAALEPHPRWRRLTALLRQPRILALIALVAVTLGVGALIGSRALLEHGGSSGGGHHHRAGAVVPAHTTVAVLNGTSSPGLAAKVSETLHENGFRRGAIGTSRTQYQQTVVMYSGGQKHAAERVAHVLGVTPVQRVDRATRAVAGRADVVVIAGADRTTS
jgi:hypothetical protein